MYVSPIERRRLAISSVKEGGDDCEATRTRTLRLVSNALAAGGIAVSVALALGAFVWWRSSRRLRQDLLSVVRKKGVSGLESENGVTYAPKAATPARWNFLRFLELDPAAIKEHKIDTVKYMSLPAYLAQLRFPKAFNWPRAIRTLLVSKNLTFVLPAVGLIMPSSKQKEEKGEDPLAFAGGTPMVSSLLSNALSPLHLYALGESVNMSNAMAQLPLKEDTDSMRRFLDGHQSVPDKLRNMPNPFIISQHLPELLADLDPEAAPTVVEGSADIPFFPDLVMAPAGLPMIHNEHHARASEVIAILMNKLAANDLPDSWVPKGRKEWVVQLRPESPKLRCVAKFMEAITSEPNANVVMDSVSRTTSFGIGVSLKEGNEYVQVPVGIPVRTGLIMLDGEAESSGANEVISLMNHSEICTRVEIPGLIPRFRVAWYLGMEGFTGWHPGTEANRPWNNEASEVHHSTMTNPKEYAEAAHYMSIIAAVSNTAADRLGLPNGGYGYIGVCNDSVATMQAALGKPVTMFPCLLAGQAKVYMHQLYSEVADQMQRHGKTHGSEICDRVRKGLLQTPCDVVQTPLSMADAGRRITANIPTLTPFKVLKRAKRDVAKVIEQYQKSHIE